MHPPIVPTLDHWHAWCEGFERYRLITSATAATTVGVLQAARERAPKGSALLEYAKTKLEQLVDSLIDPMWRKLLASPWWARLLFLALAVPIAYGLASPESAVSMWKTTGAFARVVGAGDAGLPIAPAVRTRAQEVAVRIAATLENDIAHAGQSEDSPWAVAQATLASYGVSKSLDRKQIAAYLRSRKDPACGCWREIPTNPGRQHVIFISGWILTMLVRIDEPVDADMITFLLREQSRDGSWSMFPVSSGSQYAASYGTGWALLGLHAALSAPAVDETMRAQIAGAIQSGSAWLLSQRERGSRWKDYPLLRSGNISISISGLVLHALHQTIGDRLRDVDREWLDALPSKASSVSDADHPYVWYTSKEGWTVDDWVQVQLPWILIATADAYRNGGLFQRARALRWLEDTLQQRDFASADTTPDNWWRAELLYSIEYLLAGAK